ncbi:MAG: enoyl-CoA hydratase/isomerase family protein [Candidatus Nanopelagicales bacterium]
MSDQPVTYAVADRVATITLNRPDAKNRLDLESMGMMRELLADAASDDAVRVVVLTGSGTTFCSGADLAGAVAATEGGFAAGGTTGLVGLLTDMLDHPKPIIARVQGHVAGGGNGLVAACDIAVASTEAKFAFSEVRVGVAPAIISVVCLQVMHRRDAQELLLTGERVTAERVLHAGLVTAVVEADSLDAAVQGYADALLLAGPEAVANTKTLLRRVPAMPRDDAWAWTAEMSAGLFTSAEAREGMTAFLEKRKPQWAP